ncbi:uncharacterized protein LOC124716665 [Schistocerca piceifrons]|uniref:uncharacterized protein LOC124716665 n=1 Tax=Schistocerca piceifrons TaxID=274613 RepID=UPI001F5EB5CD|nr:uncharacterized protein LOC124716665 [Schistocerca piceifrons]
MVLGGASLLLLAATWRTVAELQTYEVDWNNSSEGALVKNDVPIVQCLRRSKKYCSRVRCAAPSETCRSGMIEKCGCCKVCFVFLREHARCDASPPENTQCAPDLVCGRSGVCERINAGTTYGENHSARSSGQSEEKDSSKPNGYSSKQYIPGPY